MDLAPLTARELSSDELSMRFPAFALLLLAAAACGGERGGAGGAAGADGGTLVITTAGDADGFTPALTNSITSAQVEAQLFEKLAEPGLALNTIGDVGFTPELATSWTWSKDSLSIAFHLDPKARWHDGRPVTAKDVRFTWELDRDSTAGSVMIDLIASIDSVTVRDSLTPVFWFSHRAPEQFFVATYQMRIVPEHLLGAIPRKDLATTPFRQAPVGSGPFKFVKWDQRQAIVVEANREYHLGRPHLDRVIWSVAPDPNAMMLRLFTGDADFLEFVRPGDFAEIAKHPELKTVNYPAFTYGFLQFNLRDPKDSKKPNALWSDRALRRALSMTVDRAALVKSVFDTLAVVGVGPLTHSYPTYDASLAQLPYAPDSAAKLLDAMGWRRGADGMRAKGGRPLAFTLLVPSSSAPRRQMAELLQGSLKQAGVKVEIEQLDFATFYQKLRSRAFDVAIGGINLDPSPGNLLQSWGSEHGGPGPTNFGSYDSPAFDALVDTALSQMDPAAAKRYFARAYQVIIDDAPAVWLYEPRSFAAMQKRVQPVGMRADGWWMTMREWSIPAAERNARDKAAALPPLAAPPPAPAAPAKP